MKNVKEPKYLLILRIIGFSMLIAGITWIVLDLAVFYYGLEIIGVAMVFFSIPIIITGFSAKISKMQIERAKYVQQLNADNLTDMANTSADISSQAIVKTTKAIKRGMQDSVFCKHCGAEIDKDSKFCKKCGKEQ